MQPRYFVRRYQLISFSVMCGALLMTPAGLTLAQAPAMSESSVERGDRHFVETAAQGGMLEVALGELAQKRGSSLEVKTFGKRMVQDHSNANDDLKNVARAKGIHLSSALSSEHLHHVESLEKVKGADFDRAYMKHMLDDHKKDVSDFEKAAKSAKDADVKGFAGRTLPTLQAHLKLARTTYDAVK